MLEARDTPGVAVYRHHQGVRKTHHLDLSARIQAATAAAVLKQVASGEPHSDSNSLAPDGTVIAAFCRWWFEHTRRGVLEIGWIDARSAALTRFEQFRLDEVNALTVSAVQANLVPGQSCYIRAATVRPWDPGGGGHTSDRDFVSAPGPWGDIDTLADFERARNVVTAVRPNGQVITGTVPSMRVQSYFRASEPIVSAEMLRSLNVRLHGLYGGDPSVVNVSRLMRLPGTIAWPRKEGRVAEVTRFALPAPEEGRPRSYPVAMLTSQLPEVEKAAAFDFGIKGDTGRDTGGGIGGGLTTVSRHLAAIRGGRHWHNNVVELVAHWIGRGWSSEEIMGHCPDWTLPGWTVEQTRREVAAAIRGGREKWGVADTDPVTGKAATETLPPILDAPAFLATFTMPDYLIDGIIQRGRLHALTSPTGHGKTAVALFLACMMAMARNIGTIEVTQGDVLILGGENPDDLCVRLHAACQAYALDPALLPVFVMPGNFPLDAEAAEKLKKQVDATGRTFSLIIGDSLAAYFPGDDENHNVQMGNYARNWRVLTSCHGRPAVIALSHPIKAATRDNLLPRGGGAFLAEIDANLTLWAEGDRETTTLHWQGKIRGADFQPVTFGLTPVTLNDKRDAKDRPLMSVVATLRTSEQAEESMKVAVSDENAVLEMLRRYPGISIKDIALNCGWTILGGAPNRPRVQRRLRTLAEMKLVKSWRGKWVITDAGKAELQANGKP